MDAYTNLAFGRVLVRPEPPTSGTSLQLLVGQGAHLPAAPFNASAWPTTEYPEPANAEVVRVTAIVGDTLTIVRAQEGTTAQPIVEGWAFSQSITKKTLDDLRNASNINAGTLDKARLPPEVPLAGSAALQQWPVGSVFLGVTPTSPATLLGYGTWAAFGTGKMLVGVDVAQTEFAAAEQTGGEKTHVLTAAEMPAHTHVQNAHGHVVTDPGHTHAQDAHAHAISDPGHSHNYAHALSGGDVPSGAGPGDYFAGENLAATDVKATGIGIVPATAALYPAVTGISLVQTTAVNQNTGGGAAHNTLPPYIAVFMWKRTA